MKISFFVEPTNSINLSKLKLVKFPTKLYISEYSIESYKLYKKQLQKKHKNIKEVIWWPILNVSEGYWLSPWTKRRALLRTFHNLLKEKIPILWDAEFPKNRSLIFTQSLKYFKNKKLIKAFFEKYKGKIYTAEYFLESKFLKKFGEYSALSFSPKKYKNVTPIKMMYTSHWPWMSEHFIRNKIKELKEKHGNKVFIGLGCTAKGMALIEPIISPKQLERDIRICKEEGIKEVIIYRLGGMNKDYIKVIKKFIK